MKRLRVVLVLTTAVVGLIIWLKTERGPQAVQPVAAEPARSQTGIPLAASAPSEADLPKPSSDSTIPEPPGPVLPKPKAISVAALEEPPARLESQHPDAALPPVTALENMRTTIRQYTLRFGENPVGDNSEITAALNGKNPKQVVFLNPEDGAHINNKGQLVDTWDTPYFFHQLSRTEMEVQSAGPDRKMWTADDLVTR